MTLRRIFISLFLIGVISITFIYSFNSCKNSGEPIEEPEINKGETFHGDFIGDKKCGGCHKKEYDDWKISDHARAMLPANDGSVIGDFEDVSFSADGVKSRFFKEDGKFMVNTQGADGAYHDFEIKYTFGIHPLQQYLIEFPGGRMQTLRASWNAREKKWFHLYPSQSLDPHDWLHWSRGAQNWNAMCAGCHSTNLHTSYDASADSFNTTWDIVNVSCEACHGPGKKHAEYVSSDHYRTKEKVSGSYLVLNSNQSAEDQLVSCAPCHSRRMVVDENPFKSLQLLDHYIPEVPHTPMYAADGQIQDEDYEFQSFAQSRMYMHNVKCSNCHNAHSGKLLMAGNALCLQCHDKTLDSRDHTFHAANTEASECVSCHMPAKTYMVLDVRSDHSMRVPRPDQSVKYNTPNACNNCHAGKSPQWAAAQIVKWFGPNRRYHFSDDLIPGTLGGSAAAGHLQKLARPDTNVPAIIHATALYYMSFSYGEANISALINGLKDPNSLVRYQALSTLKFYPYQQWKADGLPLLSDPVKGVRVAAANLWLEYGDSMGNNDARAYGSARKELEAFLAMNAAEPSGRVMKADVQSRLKNYTAAEKDYLVALKMDSLLIPARINLSTMYDIEGKKDEALRQLKIASKIDPAHEQVNYYLALMYIEMNDRNAALGYFSKATATSENPRVFYNYGLLLEQMKRVNEAEKIYLKGLAIDSNDHDLNYIIALFYYNQKRNADALPYAIRLMQMVPRDAGYQQLYEAIAPE
ncbi:MAG: multiheme c-type cytochrome [Chitinophagales bacterium]